MLWIDCTSAGRQNEHRLQCTRFFDVLRCADPAQTAAAIDRVHPSVLCFDFDYPDKARLLLMQSIKRTYLSLPVLMMTVEHSETLAVWAFRVRVWNYLVKPIAAEELQENLQALLQIVAAARRSGRAVSPPEPGLPQDVPSRASNDPRALLRPALSHVERRFNERVCAEEVAALCGMNRYQFSRLFHSAFGLTFQDYLLRYRIEAACRLLSRPAASVTEVGFSVGFNDSSYFARMFKRYVGMLPSLYAEMSRKEGRLLPTREVTITAVGKPARLVPWATPQAPSELGAGSA